MQRHFFVDYAACKFFHRVRPLVLFDSVCAFDQHVFSINHAQHGTALALVPASDHDHIVTFSDFAHDIDFQSTSGASDTIFIKRSLRSSRVTGPKMRVPIGSSFAVSSTAALLSNLMTDPSARRTPFAVRTTTAL